LELKVNTQFLQFGLIEEAAGLDIVIPSRVGEIRRSDVRADAVPPYDLGVELSYQLAGEIC